MQHTKRVQDRTRGRKWMRIRGAQLEREPYCRPCKAKGISRRAKYVDHIKRLADGGTDAISNLQSICHSCHDAKTRKENSEKEFMDIGLDGYPV